MDNSGKIAMTPANTKLITNSESRRYRAKFSRRFMASSALTITRAKPTIKRATERKISTYQTNKLLNFNLLALLEEAFLLLPLHRIIHLLGGVAGETQQIRSG